MLLKELIEILERCELSKTVEGFGNPHSYRGYYDKLAFEPMTTTIKDMLEAALSANGECYTGYKGGEFTMDGDTEVHIAYEGCCGNPITKSALAEIVW
jgi:hypothetical protein